MTDSKFLQMAESIREGIVRGSAPWLVEQPKSISLPFNAVTGEVFKSINSIHLSMQDFEDPRWCSYDQAKSAGWSVIGGSKGTLLQVWKFSENVTKDGKTNKVKLEKPRLKFVYVFNAEQISGIPEFEKSGLLETKKQQIHPGNFAVRGENLPLGSDEKMYEDLASSIAVYLYNVENGTGHIPNDYSAHLERWAAMIEENPLVIFKACGEAEKLKNSLDQQSKVKRGLTPSQKEPELRPINEGSFLSFYEKSESGDMLVVNRRSKKSFPDAGVIVLNKPLYSTEKNVNFKETLEKGYDGVVFVEDGIAVRVIIPADSEKYPSMKAAGKLNPEIEKEYINVPYEQKDAAKAMGADWSGESWYFLKGVNTSEELKVWKTQEVTVIPEEAFAEVIREMGGDLNGELPIMDGKGHRIPVVDGKRGNQDMSYIGYLDGVPNGHVKNFKTQETRKWKQSGNTLTAAERKELEIQAAEKKKRRQLERAHEYEKVAKESLKHYQSLQSATGKEKYFEDYNLQINDPDVKTTPSGAVVVPFKDVKGHQWGHKTLQPNGFKQIVKGAKLEGNFYIIGAKKLDDIEGDINLVEGYSTGVALHGVINEPVVVCFTSGNMKHVAEAIKNVLPGKEFVIAADDDRDRESEGKINAGFEQGSKAAKAVNGVLIFPSFKNKEPSKERTDFRDMVKEQGKDRVQEYFLAQKKFKKKVKEKEGQKKEKQKAIEKNKQPAMER